MTVYEPILPHFEWIVKELDSYGDSMCLASQFKLDQSDLVEFCVTIVTGTGVFIAFFLVRYYWLFGIGTQEERVDVNLKEGQMSFESLDKLHLPKMLKNSSNSQSSD